MSLALALVAGALIGLSLGSLGGGGSILAVPVLLALGQTPTQATTGSLVIVGVTSLADLPELAPYLPEMDDLVDELASELMDESATA